MQNISNDFHGRCTCKTVCAKQIIVQWIFWFPYCLHVGTLGNRQVRYCNRDDAKLRTKEQTRADMLNAELSEYKVNGYSGASPLMAIASFDVLKQVAIDKMHDIDMGVIKKLFNLFLDKKNRLER